MRRSDLYATSAVPDSARDRRQSQRVLVVCGALGAIFAVGLLIGSWVLLPRPAAPVAGPSLSEQRAAHATGSIRFFRFRERGCRQLDFNNYTGTFSNDRRVPCQEPKSEPEQQSTRPRLPLGMDTERISAIRDWFMRK
jgi:hypothetical protein